MSDPPDIAIRRDDLSGLDLGGYSLLRRLGSGGMADVYLAEQRSLRRLVAVKTLRRDRLWDGGARDTLLARFEQEARAAAALVHGNIVQIHEIGCSDGIHFIAEEYVAGPSLKHWLAHRGPLSAEQAASMLLQVGSALAAAAARGIVHRDIKPENLLVTPAGDVKVADFGLARITHAGEATDLTQQGMTLGTPLYMSPEQVEGRAVDVRSDLYSLGATAYHLLAGTPPFQAHTGMAVALMHVKQPLVPLGVVRPELPTDMAAIVDQLLAKDPAARPPSPQELVHAVETCAAKNGLRRTPPPLAWPDWKDPASEAVASPPHPGRTTDSRSRPAATTAGMRSIEVQRATLRLEAALHEEAAQRRAARRFWLATTAAAAATFAFGYWFATRPRRPFLRPQRPDPPLRGDR